MQGQPEAQAPSDQLGLCSCQVWGEILPMGPAADAGRSMGTSRDDRSRGCKPSRDVDRQRRGVTRLKYVPYLKLDVLPQ